VVNAESNDDRTELERSASERMRELGRRSGEARRRRKAEKEQAAGTALELDADGVPVDLDRWSDKRLYEYANQDSNIAGGVAALKELTARRRSDPRGHDSDALVQGARDQLAANLIAMAARRQAALERGETRRLEICPACGQSTDLDSVMGRVVSALTMMSSRSSTAQPGPELSAARRPRRPGSGGR
jgi:hypothetical protein